jgi:DNA replication protein DnaC
LALSLAVAAAESGRRVYFATLADPLHSLDEAQAAGRLAHRLRTLVFPSLMVIDEIGYLPITRTGAMFFFQLMARRYEHTSTILTSNKGFEEWGEIFGDEVMASSARGPSTAAPWLLVHIRRRQRRARIPAKREEQATGGTAYPLGLVAPNCRISIAMDISRECAPILRVRGITMMIVWRRA